MSNNKRRRPRHPYPYEKWADGKTHAIYFGVDYFVHRRLVSNAIGSWARRHGYQYNVWSRHDGGLDVRMWKEFVDG